MEVFRQFVKNIYLARLFSAEHLFHKENCLKKPQNNKAGIQSRKKTLKKKSIFRLKNVPNLTSKCVA